MRAFSELMREGSIPLAKLTPIQLAFLGDSIFDLIIRRSLLTERGFDPNQLHRAASSYANARSQARMMQLILDDLTEEEAGVFRRARNHKALSPPKNMPIIDYKWATGLEALLGYLFLKGEEERLLWLMDRALDRFQKEAHHPTYLLEDEER